MTENSDVVTSGQEIFNCPSDKSSTVTNLQLPKIKAFTGRGRSMIIQETIGNKRGRSRKVTNPEVHIANLGGVSTEDVAIKPSEKQPSIKEMLLIDIKRDWISAVTKAQSKGAYNNLRDEIFDSCKSIKDLTHLYENVFKANVKWQTSVR